MAKPTKIDRIANMFLEQYGLKEELDSISNFILRSENGFVYYSNGEVVNREEHIKRMERKLEILEFVIEKAKKTTLIEGEITLTDPEAK